MDQEDQRERVVSLFREMTQTAKPTDEKAKKRKRMVGGTTIIDSTIVVCSEACSIERVIAQLLGKKQRANNGRE